MKHVRAHTRAAMREAHARWLGLELELAKALLLRIEPIRSRNVEGGPRPRSNGGRLAHAEGLCDPPMPLEPLVRLREDALMLEGAFESPERLVGHRQLEKGRRPVSVKYAYSYIVYGFSTILL